jgi:hypothetical protein
MLKVNYKVIIFVVAGLVVFPVRAMKPAVTVKEINDLFSNVAPLSPDPKILISMLEKIRKNSTKVKFDHNIFNKIICYHDLKNILELKKVCKSYLIFTKLFLINKNHDLLSLKILQKNLKTAIDFINSHSNKDFYVKFSSNIIDNQLVKLFIQEVKNKNIIIGIDFSDCYQTITDAEVTAVAKNYKNLKYICLEVCQKITDTSLIALAKNCNQLKFINLEECHQITDSGAKLIFSNCKNLEDVNLNECTNISDISVIILANNCVNLKYFSYDSCHRIKYDALLTLTKNCKKLKNAITS